MNPPVEFMTAPGRLERLESNYPALSELWLGWKGHEMPEKGRK